MTACPKAPPASPTCAARATNGGVKPMATTKTIRRRFFSLAGRLTHKARRSTLHLPRGWSLPT